MQKQFEQKIWAAIAHADFKNLIKLHKAFPDYVDAYQAWTTGDLHDRIQNAGMDI